MSLFKEILYTISNYPGGYRLIYNILYENESSETKPNERSVRTTLSRMKKKGLIIRKNDAWQCTALGKEILKQKSLYPPHFISKKFKKGIKKTTIIIFDIPEKKRNYRDWLRYELQSLGFELIQKSVWFGPPVPKEFILYLGEIKLLPYIRFFQVRESDLM